MWKNDCQMKFWDSVNDENVFTVCTVQQFSILTTEKRSCQLSLSEWFFLHLGTLLLQWQKQRFCFEQHKGSCVLVCSDVANANKFVPETVGHWKHLEITSVSMRHCGRFDCPSHNWKKTTHECNWKRKVMSSGGSEFVCLPEEGATQKGLPVVADGN